MKKLFFTALIMLFVISANAQVEIGVKGGINFADISIEDIDTENKKGYHFGAFVIANMGDNFAIQPELLFSKQGTQITNGAEWDFSYLTVPVLLKVKFLKVLQIHAGPQFGFLFSGESDDQDIDDTLKSTDFSLIAGAGVDFPKGLVGGVRYIYGVSDLNDGVLGFESVEIQNRTLQLYLGVKLF